MNYENIEILGFKIARIGMDNLLLEIESFISSKKVHTIVLLNPYMILEARKYSEYAAYIQSANLITADGIGLLLAGRLLGKSFPERVTGSDLMPALAELGVKNNYRFYLVGAKPGIVNKAAMFLENRYPGLQIIGMHHGYFNAEEEIEIVKDIKKKKPDILIVCMGVNKQEMFIKRHIHEINVPVCFGNGAALDFVSGHIKRAPKWMQKRGIEWGWRLIQEPWRLWKRYLIGNILFMWLILKEFVRIRILKQ